MYMPPPQESLVNRLLISLGRGEIDKWGPKLFAEQSLLLISGRDSAEHRGSARITQDFFGPLRAELASSVLSAVEVVILPDAAVLSFDCAGGCLEVFMRVQDGKFNDMWAYPAGQRPSTVAALYEEATVPSSRASCCGG
jgi:hypothetical protein